ncbi:MAG TPA: RNA polymerase sigma factor RpoD/SigA [Bacteroidia bacterium]|nr:RNA polymerase sigma factor RpoD/SigA [Bacteroidia bacterium]HNP98697.1 RNA polymerase sigma factor RpoD/SigA [Bacteroidia bacterium]
MRQLKISKSITNRSSASLEMYLHDISKLPMVTMEEETLLAQRIKNGDQTALKKLVSANLRFVVSVAKQYQNQGISLSDLINEGNTGLIKAASRFDETRGFKFISYAVWWIRQSIMQSISEQSRVIRLPLNKIGTLNKIRKAQGVLEQQLERSPTNSEIAAFVDLNEDEINFTRNSSSWHVSTDANLPGQEELTLMDFLHNPDDSKPDHVLIADSLRIEISRALETLSEKEKEVLIQYYGIAGTKEMSLEEIGKKYDLTRERVRQIKEKAIRKLKVKSRSRNLVSYLG